MTKDGEVQGPNNEGDLTTKRDLLNLSNRFAATYLEDVAAENTTATLSAADVRKGILTSTPSSGITLTSPTAALLVAEDGDHAVGRGYEFVIVNLHATNTATLAAGTGVTLVGNAIVAGASSTRFYVRYNNVTASSEAVTIFRV